MNPGETPYIVFFYHRTLGLAASTNLPDPETLVIIENIPWTKLKRKCVVVVLESQFVDAEKTVRGVSFQRRGKSLCR